MCQIQGQLEVLELDWCDFVVWTEDGGTIQRVRRCPEYWGWMEPRLAEFWAYVVADVPPPRLKRKTFPVFHDLVTEVAYFLNPRRPCGRPR